MGEIILSMCSPLGASVSGPDCRAPPTGKARVQKPLGRGSSLGGRPDPPAMLASDFTHTHTDTCAYSSHTFSDCFPSESTKFQTFS